ncbi:MAG: hypothetical protein B7Y21_12795 [Hydrogenophilales bacterium 16-61-112]|nr:MAG: hypothetical protein B7Y21_12795 [Hydrogenophilales bacterium 16-61-112]
MRQFLALTVCLLATAVAQAAPRHIELVYDLYRNGHKLGQVTDTFSRSGKQYTLVSETRASGPLAMLWPGAIRLKSTGEVTRAGLRPTQFEHARSDAPHKLATARLDWKQQRIDFKYKGRSWQVEGLQAGAQDQLSQLYQMMFAPSVPADYTLQVVSGRDLNDYHYVRSDGGSLVWVAPARQHLPVQVRVVDEGVTVEQRLVRATVKN